MREREREKGGGGGGRGREIKQEVNEDRCMQHSLRKEKKAVRTPFSQ